MLLIILGTLGGCYGEIPADVSPLIVAVANETLIPLGYVGRLRACEWCG